MTDIATREPEEFFVGDTLEWQKSLSDYPAPTWTLRYYMAGVAGEIAIVATASGADHLVSVAKATTAAYKAGRYRWRAVVDDGTDRVTLAEGDVLVKPDPAKVGAGFDPRSHARRTLDAIEAVIEKRATKDQEEYTIGTRSLKRTPAKELLEFRDRYRAEVNREDIAAGKLGGKMVVRL